MLGIADQHWHPLLVHFPIALWSVGTIFYVLTFVPALGFLRQASIWMGLLGCGLGYLTIEAGEKAAEVLGAGLCQKASDIVLRHSDQAHSTFIFMLVGWGIAAVQEYILLRYLSRFSQFKVFNIIASLALVCGMIFLVKTGHKGFRLVFEEQVGVIGSEKNCE